MKAVMTEDCATTEIDFISKDNSPFFTEKKIFTEKNAPEEFDLDFIGNWFIVFFYILCVIKTLF